MFPYCMIGVKEEIQCGYSAYHELAVNSRVNAVVCEDPLLTCLPEERAMSDRRPRIL